MRTLVLLIIAILFSFNGVRAQNFTINLYPEGEIPNFIETNEEEKIVASDVVRISNVQQPNMAVFLPSKKNATGEAVVICPGGGYHILAYDSEGVDIAKFFNSKGIAAVVLKYRLPTSANHVEPHKSPLMDAQRAMRLVRENAGLWNIDSQKVGIMGFSAGGHLASTLSTHYDLGNPDAADAVERLSCRPDFSILIYPVITFTGDFQHQGSRKALVGDDQQLMEYYSNEKQITNNTPPALLVHSSDDKAVPVENSIVYYQGLIKHGIKAEMHIYSYGGHGYSLATGKGHLSSWPDRVIDFIGRL